MKDKAGQFDICAFILQRCYYPMATATTHWFIFFAVSEIQPRLNHAAVKQNRDAQQQAPPEADTEQLLMSRMVCAMASMSGMVFMGRSI